MIGRELAKAKIKKLRKMTTLAGCTPDEEASAAAKIAELMTKYRLNVMGEHDNSDLSVIYRPRSAEEAIHRPAPPPPAMTIAFYAAVIGFLVGILLVIRSIIGDTGTPSPSPSHHHTRVDPDYHEQIERLP